MTTNETGRSALKQWMAWIAILVVVAIAGWALMAFAPNYVPLPGGVQGEAQAATQRFTRADLRRIEVITNKRVKRYCYKKEAIWENSMTRSCLISYGGPCASRVPARRDAAYCEGVATWVIELNGRFMSYYTCETTMWYRKVNGRIRQQYHPDKLWACYSHKTLRG